MILIKAVLYKPVRLVLLQELSVKATDQELKITHLDTLSQCAL